MSKWTRLLPFALATLLATPAFAEPPAPAGSAAAAGAGQRFKKARGEILRKRLSLDEAKAVAVEKVLDRYAPERKKLREVLKDQQKALRELIKSKSDDQAAFKRALDALESAQTKMNALRVQEQAELRKLLTPKQQAILLQVMAHARRLKNGQGQAPPEQK